MSSSVTPYTKKPKEGEPWDIAIIGSGPAAFTAAIYATRGAASTILLGGEKWGGQLMLTTEVDNFPAHKGIEGPDLMMKMREHALAFGGELVERFVEKVDFSDPHALKLSTSEKEYQARSVIIATGSDTRWLGVAGEEKLRGRGVSSCAPCDAPFFKDKRVLVIGGGDSAMEEALVLAKYASNVIVVHRRDEFRASKAMQQKVFDHEKIDIVWDTSVEELLGDQKLEGARFTTPKSSKHVDSLKNDVMKKYSATIIEEKGDALVWKFPTDGLFVAIGHIPASGIFEGQIELDQKGYVVKHTKDGFQTATNKKGVFVSGDIHDHHYMQAITASAFGCMAGMDALRYLEQIEK